MPGRTRNPTVLAAGALTSGILAYGFFAVSTRALGAELAAPVSVLWTYWSFSAACLTFPLQHWIARSVAAQDGEASVRAAMSRVVALIAAASLGVGALSWLGRDQLFHRDDIWFPVLVSITTIGSGFIGVVRGGLAARHQFGALALTMVADNGLRCASAIVLMIAGVDDSLAYGSCLAGAAVVGLLWPQSFRFVRDDDEASTESAMRFIGGAAGGQLIGQAVLTGGPVALSLAGGEPAEVTALFAGLALFRAPYTLAIGLVAALTGRLTKLVVAGQTTRLRQFRLGTLAGTAVTVLIAAVIGEAIGPWLLRLIFGDEVRLDNVACLLVAVGSAFALANLVVTVSIMALNRSGVIARAWVTGVVGGVIGYVVAGTQTDALLQTCWAFVTAEALAFVVLVFEDHRGAMALQRGQQPVSASARRPHSSSS
jgi:O-antigen/teichoic acid export membrane protein